MSENVDGVGGWEGCIVEVENWKKKEAKFKEQLKQIDEESKGGYIEDLKHISSVKDSIGDIIKIFREMKMFDANEKNLADNIVVYLKKNYID